MIEKNQKEEIHVTHLSREHYQHRPQQSHAQFFDSDHDTGSRIRTLHHQKALIGESSMTQIVFFCHKSATGTISIPCSAEQVFMRRTSTGLMEIVLPQCPTCNEEHASGPIGEKKHFEYSNRQVSIGK